MESSKKFRIELTEQQKAELSEKLKALENDIIREASDEITGGTLASSAPYSKIHGSGGFEKSL